MKRAVWRRVSQALLIWPILSSALLLFPARIYSQTPESPRRKLLVHDAPPYPELAFSLALWGIVKVDALVAPDGSVKDVKVVGGHPVLAQATVRAVREWKWEPSAHESHELVVVKFAPRK
jgi:TonB family protein